MRVYIDKNFKCHASDDGSMRAVETDFFNGKCTAFVDGHRFVPEGETWIRPDGVVFKGEMVAAWVNFQELDAAQREYEQALLAEYEEALAMIFEGVTE